MDAIDKINILLAKRGLSGAELSKMIGVSSGVYSQWNTKQTKPSNKSLYKIAAALEVDISDLTGEQKEKTPSEGSLTADQKDLLSIWDSIPQEKQADALRLLKVLSEPNKPE